MTRAITYPLALLLAVVACDDGDGDDEGTGAEPLFPADVEARYTEVRPCMPSGDHNLNNVRILVDDAALDPYLERTAPFPEGAVVVKPEYDFGDATCAGDVVRWTVMRKLPAGSAAGTLDWAWQTVEVDRTVLDEDLPQCISCHRGCGVAPDGHDGTCAILQ